MEPITVKVEVSAPANKVWNYFTKPEHVVKWNHASDDWHTPKAESDLVLGGKFTYRMESKDGSKGFDFSGIYTAVEPNRHIQYRMEDGREVDVTFEEELDATTVIETFDPETENPAEMQRAGWQSILDNFKAYVEKS
jgi:uncharacterized protein YndB with AHSA1/START domain